MKKTFEQKIDQFYQNSYKMRDKIANIIATDEMFTEINNQTYIDELLIFNDIESVIDHIVYSAKPVK